MKRRIFLFTMVLPLLLMGCAGGQSPATGSREGGPSASFAGAEPSAQESAAVPSADVSADSSSESASPGAVSISFPYVHQDGIASNQFAVWVESEDGAWVKTLFATQFIASGGYVQWPEALPTWVERSGLKDGTASAVDAVTGATPETGTQQFLWDCKDSDGEALPNGAYSFFVEASLRWENRVLYTGTITIGGDQNSAAASAAYFGENPEERTMIGEVTAVYTPDADA